MKFHLTLGVAAMALTLASPAFAELKFEPGKDARFHWADLDALKKVDLKGETLTIFGPWRGDDETLVQNVLEYFREATGAEVKYSSSENYEQQIVIDTQAGSPPNIAVLPQPGCWPISPARDSWFRWATRPRPSSRTIMAPVKAG